MSVSIWKLVNTGGTTYNNFSFTDSAGNLKVFNVEPDSSLYQYYVDATDPVTSQGSVVATSYGAIDRVFEFTGCCYNDSFYFSGNSTLWQEHFGGTNIGYAYGFINTISSSNPNNTSQGCYELLNTGTSSSYIFKSVLGLYYGAPYTGCSECLIENPCVTPTPTNTTTPTPTPTITQTPTNTTTNTSTPTTTPSNTPTQSVTPSITPTNTQTPTTTPTLSLTPTNTPTNTETPTQTPTPSFTPTPSETPPPGVVCLYTDICISENVFGYSDTYTNLGFYNSHAYFSANSKNYVVYFSATTGWCLSTSLGGPCLLTGALPCYSDCPDFCDDIMSTTICPTPTPSQTQNCSVLNFNALFDCDYSGTPTPTPTTTQTSTPTPTPTPTIPCNVGIDVTGYTYSPTPTPTSTCTPSVTPEVTYNCSFTGDVSFNTIDCVIQCSVSQQFQDCYDGKMYYTTNAISNPSSGPIEQFMVFRATVDGVSRCLSYIGINYEVSGINQITLNTGPYGYSNLGECIYCSPVVSQTPTTSMTPTTTPTNTPTPSATLPFQYYVYKSCTNPNNYVVQDVVGPLYTTFYHPLSSQCWTFVQTSLTNPTSALQLYGYSVYQNFGGNYFSTISGTYLTCLECTSVDH